MKEKAKAEVAQPEEAKAITLESNVGLCGLRIVASIKQNAELASKFLGYFLWHDGASAVYGGGKKAAFNRESPYSDALGEHAKAVLLKVLSPFFDVQSIETYGHVKQTEEQKFMKFCKSLGMSEEQARQGWVSAQVAASVAPPKPAEVVLE